MICPVMIGLPRVFSLMILDELALKVVDVDEDFGTCCAVTRVPISMSPSCWGKSGGEGGVRYRVMEIGPRPLEQGTDASGSVSCSKLV